MCVNNCTVCPSLFQSEIYPDKEHGGRVFRNQAVMSSLEIPQVIQSAFTLTCRLVPWCPRFHLPSVRGKSCTGGVYVFARTFVFGCHAFEVHVDLNISSQGH